MGLWIIQECQREWERRAESALTFPQIVEDGRRAPPPFTALIDLDEAELPRPRQHARDDRREYCRRDRPAPCPEGAGEIGPRGLRVPGAQATAGRSSGSNRTCCTSAVYVLHIVGGGSNNEMLNRFTADALGIPVLAGPSEATAIGNLLLQARALGLVGDLWEMRRIVADSFGVRRIEPGDRAPWDAAYKTYREIVGR